MAVIDENAAWVRRQEIFQEVEIERRRQDGLWGPDFDDQNTINDWATYINNYLAEATKMDRATKILDVQRIEDNLLKVVALGVAALETIRRNGRPAARHYDVIALPKEGEQE